MTIPLGHSKEKYVNVFFEATRPKIRVKLYKEKPDCTVDYEEPSFHPRNQFVLLDLNEMEDVLTETFAQIQETIDAEWLWVDRGSWIV